MCLTLSKHFYLIFFQIEVERSLWSSGNSITEIIWYLNSKIFFSVIMFDIFIDVGNVTSLIRIELMIDVLKSDEDILGKSELLFMKSGPNVFSMKHTGTCEITNGFKRDELNV